MPNLLGNPHSFSVQGLCTMLIVSARSPLDAHCNPSPPTLMLEAASSFETISSQSPFAFQSASSFLRR